MEARKGGGKWKPAFYWVTFGKVKSAWNRKMIHVKGIFELHRPGYKDASYFSKPRVTLSGEFWLFIFFLLVFLFGPKQTTLRSEIFFGCCSEISLHSLTDIDPWLMVFAFGPKQDNLVSHVFNNQDHGGWWSPSSLPQCKFSLTGWPTFKWDIENFKIKWLDWLVLY